MGLIVNPYVFATGAPSTDIQVLGVSTAAFDSDGGTSMTQSYALPAGTDFIIVPMGWATDANRDVSSITWNGASLTAVQAPTETSSFGVYSGAGIYYRAAPDVGTHDLVVTMNGAAADIAVQIIACKNIAQTSPVNGTTVTSTTTGTTKTQTHTTTVTDTIRVGVRYIVAFSVTSFAPGTGVTEVADVINGAATDGFFAGHHIASTSGAFDFASTATRNTAFMDIGVVAGFKKAGL